MMRMPLYLQETDPFCFCEYVDGLMLRVPPPKHRLLFPVQ